MQQVQTEGGVCRALVAVDDVTDEQKDTVNALASWKETHRVKPAWIDESSAMHDPSALSSRSGKGSTRHHSSPRASRSPRRSLGWVTLAKGGRDLVALSSTLPAGDRQQHLRAWSRRLAVDRSLGGGRQQKLGSADSGSSAADAFAAAKSRSGSAQQLRAGRRRGKVNVKDQQGKYENELAADPHHIGFAFGGMEPGRVHARGKLIETHKVLNLSANPHLCPHISPFTFTITITSRLHHDYFTITSRSPTPFSTVTSPSSPHPRPHPHHPHPPPLSSTLTAQPSPSPSVLTLTRTLTHVTHHTHRQGLLFSWCGWHICAPYWLTPAAEASPRLTVPPPRVARRCQCILHRTTVPAVAAYLWRCRRSGAPGMPPCVANL